MTWFCRWPNTCIFHGFGGARGGWWFQFLTIHDYLDLLNLLEHVRTTYGGVKVVYQPLKLTAPWLKIKGLEDEVSFWVLAYFQCLLLFVSMIVLSQSFKEGTWKSMLLEKETLIYNTCFFVFHVKLGECKFLPIWFALSFTSTAWNISPAHGGARNWR